MKKMQKGDAFVVCDAGGGTVDLISYEITSIKPSLELAELVPGKGNDVIIHFLTTIAKNDNRRHGWLPRLK